MSKYKTSDALKIKKEIIALQKEREDLINDICSLTEEREKLQKGVSTWRGIFKGVEESFAAKLNNRMGQLQKVDTQIVEKKTQGEKLDGSLLDKQQLMAALKDSIRRARETKHEDQTSFVKDVLRHLQQSVAENMMKRDNLTEEVSALQAKQQAISATLNKLQSDKTAVVNQIQALLQAILEGKRQLTEVMAEVEKHQDTIKQIEVQEHDSRVMLMRLSEQYRAVYNSRPHGTLDSRI